MRGYCDGAGYDLVKVLVPERGMRMPKRRDLLALATLSELSACALVEKFSFEDAHHDLVVFGSPTHRHILVHPASLIKHKSQY